MITPASHPTVNRRQLIQIGGIACLGLSLPRLLRAEANQPPSSSTLKSCILIYYYGGPSHLDTWDLKANAPAEVRGLFRPIATRVPGLFIGEHLPHSARITDKLTIVRSFHHPMRNHNSAAVEALCGRTPLKGDLELLADDPNSFPCYGSALSYLTPGRRTVPTHVALPHVMHNVVVLPGQTAGFLGAAANPFQVAKDPNEAGFGVGELELPADLPLNRLEDRQSLLSIVDTQKARAEKLARRKVMSVYQEKAFQLLHSEEVRRGFDLSRESAVLRDRYGRNTLG